MKFGSVCSGIEAASVAWHPLGWKAAWLAEIEPFPSAVLAHHYPDVPNIGDMTKLLDLIPSGGVEAPDVFCGGTPCQAFSVAGLRKSLDDARGNLSLIFCEIANAIDSARHVRGEEPAIIFWENVPGVLSTKDNAFGCFLAGLAGEDGELVAPGGKWANAGAVYGPKRAVAWRVLDAQYFGVAQRRRRVFVVASARTGFDPAAVLFEFDGVRRDTAPSRQAREAVTHATAPCLTSSGRGVERTGGTRGQDPVVAVTCMAHGQGGAEIASERRTTLTCNHEAPIAAYSTKLHNTASNQAGKVYEGYCTSLDANSPPPAVFAPMQHTTHTLRGEGFDASEGGTGRGTPLVPVAISFGAQMSVPQVDFELNQTLQAKNPMAVAFSAKDYGADATVELSPTLRAGNSDTSHANSGNWMGVQQTMQVRRLTPVECERLQGFPDNYTAIPWRTAQEAKRKGVSYESLLAQRGMTLRGPSLEDCPDCPRYKAIGNSWAVPNVRWIGARIKAELERLKT